MNKKGVWNQHWIHLTRNGRTFNFKKTCDQNSYVSDQKVDVYQYIVMFVFTK